jgi:hypothetical protein
MEHSRALDPFRTAGTREFVSVSPPPPADGTDYVRSDNNISIELKSWLLSLQN